MCKHSVIALAAFLIAVFTACTSVAPSTRLPEKPISWGDQGDGTYKNPVLCGDYSDPDVIRVGDDFYLVTSTFHLSPGVTILHSKDLVNWRIIGHAFNDLSEFDKAYSPDQMAHYGHGTWAAAIRYHDGKFWVYVFDTAFGLYMTTADNPAGPWAPATQVMSGAQYCDCCPFWDDDGQMYLTGARYPLGVPEPRTYDMLLWKLSPDGKKLLDNGTVIHRGHGAEATKILKINGWYYIFYCEHQDGDFKRDRMQLVMRSKNLYGPYEHHRMIQQRETRERSPCQGGLVDSPDGSWWFLHQQGDLDYLGRQTSLEPVTWMDGWPIVGKPRPDGVGSMVWQWKKPIQGQPIAHPQSDDEFDGAAIKHQWQWNHAPRNDKWSLAERPGFLRLKASVTKGRSGFFGACNTLSQRTMGYGAATATTRIEVDGMADGQESGLCIFSNGAWMLQVVQENGKRFLRAAGSIKNAVGPEVTGSSVWLRAESQGNAYRFLYSLDGKTFTRLGDEFRVNWGDWRGVRIGVFTWNGAKDAGHIDVDWFHYDYGQHAGKKTEPNQ